MSARVHRLANGVRVVCDPMAGLESLALSVVVRGGARWEGVQHNGWSHLLEHMVFKGAGDRSAREIVEVVEEDGGNLNAATGYERTSYQARTLAGGLPLALAVIGDLVRRPRLEADDLEREKSVIGQEIAEAADTPDDRVFDLAQTQAYAGQALGRPILGSPQTIDAASPATLAAFHRALYAPDRIVVSAAGAVEEDELLRLVEAQFGDAAAPSDPLPDPAPAAFRGGRLREARKLEQAHLVMLLPGVGARHGDYFALRLFAEALGGGMSSRLFQEAREARGLAYAIDAYAESYEDAGVLGIYAGTAAADAAQTARLSVELIRALADAPRADELRRAKAQAKAHLLMARESPMSRAEQAAGQLLLFDRLFPAGELVQSVEAVEAIDFARIGAGLLGQGRASERAGAIAVLGPKRAGDAVDAFQEALSS